VVAAVVAEVTARGQASSSWLVVDGRWTSSARRPSVDRHRLREEDRFGIYLKTKYADLDNFGFSFSLFLPFGDNTCNSNDSETSAEHEWKKTSILLLLLSSVISIDD